MAKEEEHHLSGPFSEAQYKHLGLPQGDLSRYEIPPDPGRSLSETVIDVMRRADNVGVDRRIVNSAQDNLRKGTGFITDFEPLIDLAKASARAKKMPFGEIILSQPFSEVGELTTFCRDVTQQSIALTSRNRPELYGKVSEALEDIPQCMAIVYVSKDLSTDSADTAINAFARNMRALSKLQLVIFNPNLDTTPFDLARDNEVLSKTKRSQRTIVNQPDNRMQTETKADAETKAVADVITSRLGASLKKAVLFTLPPDLSQSTVASSLAEQQPYQIIDATVLASEEHFIPDRDKTGLVITGYSSRFAQEAINHGPSRQASEMDAENRIEGRLRRYSQTENQPIVVLSVDTPHIETFTGRKDFWWSNGPFDPDRDIYEVQRDTATNLSLVQLSRSHDENSRLPSWEKTTLGKI